MKVHFLSKSNKGINSIFILSKACCKFYPAVQCTKYSHFDLTSWVQSTHLFCLCTEVSTGVLDASPRHCIPSSTIASVEEEAAIRYAPCRDVSANDSHCRESPPCGISNYPLLFYTEGCNWIVGVVINATCCEGLSRIMIVSDKNAAGLAAVQLNRYGSEICKLVCKERNNNSTSGDTRMLNRFESNLT